MFAIKVESLNWESQTQAENIHVGLPSSPIKIWCKSVQGFRRYNRTSKQTNRDRRWRQLQEYQTDIIEQLDKTTDEDIYNKDRY